MVDDKTVAKMIASVEKTILSLRRLRGVLVEQQRERYKQGLAEAWVEKEDDWDRALKELKKTRHG